MNLSFSGCGFLGIYHVGVASAIKEYAPDVTVEKITGASAGGLAAACLLCDCCLGQATSDILKTVVQALICSAFIPFYCGTVPPTYKGVRYIDGGWSDNLPVLDAETVTVSPFSGESDICPSDSDSASFLGFWTQNTSIRFTARNMYRVAIALFPPHPEVLSQMCRQGFEDALRFLVKYDLIACTRCIAVRSCITLPEKRPQPTLSRVNSERVMEASSGNQRNLVSAPSFANFRQVRARLNSASESECEHCRDVSHKAPRKGLPKLVKKSLAKAEADENTWLRYLMKTKAMKMLRYLTIPCILPWEMTYTGCVRLLEWLPTLPQDMFWFVRSTTEIAKGVLHEIELHRHKYSARFTCQLAVTDLNYFRPPTSTNTDDLTESNRSINFSARSRRSSAASLASTSGLGFGTGECPVTETKNEMNYGFSMNLNSQSSPVKCFTAIVDKDDLSSINQNNASEIAKAAVALEQYGFKAPLSNMEYGNYSETDTDTMANILEFTNRHEALMVYYYTDDKSGQVTVTEIFGTEDKVPLLPPQTARLACVAEGSKSNRSSRRNSIQDGRESPAPVPGDKDSYKSILRSSRAGSFRELHLEDKDASKHIRCGRGGSFRDKCEMNKIVKRTNVTYPHRSKRFSAPPLWQGSKGSESSDSEGDTERLWCPKPNQSSNECDYEPEDSSEDP